MRSIGATLPAHLGLHHHGDEPEVATPTMLAIDYIIFVTGSRVYIERISAVELQLSVTTEIT